MNKAIIDQMMLGLFIFFVLVAIGATVSDNMQARDKFYNLKKITDNSVLSLSKYYVRVDENTADAETTNYNMLSETKLGIEVREDIVYDWDFASDPNTVTATVANYEEETFWFKFLGLDSFTLSAKSIATITPSDDPTQPISYGMSPFAVNERDFLTLIESVTPVTLNYALTADWILTDENTFYPVFPDCDCDCEFMLSNQFDFSDLGFNNPCSPGSTGCTTHGESEFTQYASGIDDFYNDQNHINFDDGTSDTPICLAGTYLGNTTSTWNTQINHLSNGIESIIGNNGNDLPIEMDFLVLGTGATAYSIVRFEITAYDSKSTGPAAGRYISLTGNFIYADEIVIIE